MMLAWPLAINALLVQSMLMIDTLLVAPLGELPVAAMGLATTIVTFVLGIEIAIGNGVQMLVGRVHGANSQTQLAVTFWCGLIINVSTSLFFLLILMLFSTDLLMLISDNVELVALADSYISITQYLVLITAFTQVSTAFFNGCGNTKLPLLSFLIELPFNAILSYFLINGALGHHGLGLEGAAWGSLVAVIFRALFLYIALRKDANADLRYPSEYPLWAELHKQFFEIYPIAANFFILSVGATVYQLLFAQLNLYSFVAITLIFPWIRAGTQFPNAWAQASAITISQALGQNRKSDIKEFVPRSTQVVMIIASLIAGLFFLLSQYIDWIYPELEDDTLNALAVIAPLYILLPIIRAYNTVAGNSLRAIGYSNLVLKIHFITQWLLALPICALLILHFNVSIFWAFAMLPIEELLKTIPFHRYKNRLINGVSVN